MAGPTIHQRVSGWLWHWRDGPGWVRDGSEIAKLRQDGMRVLKVQLQDDGPIPRELCDEWRAAGVKVWGAVRPSHAPLGGTIWEPEAAAQWIRDERVRLALAGIDLNFEREVRDADSNTAGTWSASFVRSFRRLCPTLPAHLDTVYGDFAGGINNVYTPNIRMTVQTYWGPEGIWDDPPTNIVKWCAGASPVIPKAVVKPLFRVAPNNAGNLPDWNVVFADTQKAGTKGLGLYYIDACDFGLLRWLIQESVARGIAY